MIADYLAREPGQSRLRFSQTLHRRRDPDRRLCLHAAALLRFFGLHRYRHRVGAAAGHQAAAELQPAVRRAQHRRFLAPLAHQLLQLAARLSVLLAARAAFEVEDLHLPEPGDHHGARRTVARAELELRHLGRAARRGAGGDPRLATWRGRRPAARAWQQVLCAVFVTSSSSASPGSSSARPI